MRPVAESGDELALFAHARNWKRYVAAELAPYIAGRVLEVGAGTGNATETLCTGAIESWLCLEPNAELASEIVAKIAGGQIPGHCRVRIGDLHGLDDADRFDAILYIDVLEHIEPDYLDNVLDDLQSLVQRCGFFPVHIGPAIKTLPDGRNAHLIQQPPAWWLPRLLSHFELVVFQRMPQGFWVLVERKPSGPVTFAPV